MSGALAYNQSFIENRPPNVAVQFLDRVKTSPPARRTATRTATAVEVGDLEGGRRPGQPARRRPAGAGHRARAARRHRLRHPLRVDPRRPRGHVRRRRHHDRLPVAPTPRTRPTSSPTPSARSSSPRTTTQIAKLSEHKAELPHVAQGRHLRRHRRRRLGDRASTTSTTLGDDATSPSSPDVVDETVDGHQPRPAGHPDLHLRHHRPAQGRPAAPRLLDLRGRGDPGPGHPRRGRPAVPAGCRWRTRSARCCCPTQLACGFADRRRRPGRQDHRQPRAS